MLRATVFFFICHNTHPTQELYTHIRALHLSRLTVAHAHACVHARAEHAPGIRSPVLFHSLLAFFCWGRAVFSYPLGLFSCSLFISSEPYWLLPRYCFTRTSTRWTHVNVRFRAASLLYPFFSSLFFLPLLLYEGVFPALLGRRAYRTSQHITSFIASSEIKPLSGPERRKVSS